MTATVLIPAAGMGRRMGADINKQYLQLAGRPILAHTLSLFDQSPHVSRIIVVSPADEIAYCRREVVARFGLRKVEAVIAGGAERQDSVRNGLRHLGEREPGVVLIHDGVRPFFPARLIPRVIAAAAEQGGCVVGVPVKDTVKEVEDGRIRATPERGRLWLAQTPQAFSCALVRDAHEQALADGFRGTDDASLVERLGHRPAMLEGSYRNIKITTPEDLLVAEAFLTRPEEP
ncbi:2-C-methyl-D-erythritol 4-phosphate cytidylyltransferase [Geoalkalibacter halelectricus]|uniref:2-C-methyl-D-erythritol 4-phosphate cytidylyltransferase n=1 Tax=Geoalkalibacter halelectricus TaxID=2847045 RepID=A0ABY5ZR50_9BACT|nr:2-C-methyl-D-erythritol 4-phosphate cytidylyltransferase [Geoalkalibacter halelectricus]MDO3378335.1 2-C-methyl-D-erythritol 4-phosphate cytidylyltransferase [Geoalkalibacter halelectricus]UWZ80345.1 2-C-methyl-D-erythritol 4-phosphate cytidylyltransferase [Geoalkalibacter halelectricus]